MLDLQGHRAVRSEQPVRALSIGNPDIVEEHDVPQQAEVLGARACGGGGLRLVWRWRRTTHEHEPCMWPALYDSSDRIDRTHRIEPVPQATVPQHYLG